MDQTGSSRSFILSVRFSHSSAILTIPWLISFCSACVCMASSTTSVGSVPGFSCTDRLTRPFRYPNSVPVTRAPDSWNRLPLGSAGNLQTGWVMIGNDRKTDLTTRNTFSGLFPFFLLTEGSTRDNGGGDGGRDDTLSVLSLLGSPVVAAPSIIAFYESPPAMGGLVASDPSNHPSSSAQSNHQIQRVDENQKFEGLRGEERETSSVKDASVLRSFGRRRHPCHYLGLAKQAFLKCLGLDSSSESESDNNVKQGKED
nr:uncharacterized protein LOC109191710 [Ipomoea batatas]GMC94683.1 uncharacterized protein LOC109191710 [Ipomoea batatas]